MGLIEQTIAEAVRIGVAEAVKPLEQKVNALCDIEAKRMMNKSESAEYMGVSLYFFNNMTKSPSFPKAEDGLWSRGELENWMNNR
jgi:hypothetical protein